MRYTSLVLLAALLCTLTACRDNGLLTISGNVTLDGKPIENGSISLMPVDGKGISGGGVITNGRYTAESSPGEMAVQINAIEKFEKKNPTKEEIERGLHIDQRQILPPEYNRVSKLRIQVSSSDKVHDFALTSDGAIPSK